MCRLLIVNLKAKVKIFRNGTYFRGPHFSECLVCGVIKDLIFGGEELRITSKLGSFPGISCWLYPTKGKHPKALHIFKHGARYSENLSELFVQLICF